MQQQSEAQPAQRISRRRRNGKNGKQTLFFDRELSWLDFNARVLAEAQNAAHPLLERLKFLCIFSNNLDEFFMIHVPGMRQRADEETGRPRTAQQIQERLADFQAKLNPMLKTLYQCFAHLMEQLAAHDIRILSYKELSSEQQAELNDYFEREVFPVLTPLALDPGHPFPYISNQSLSLAVLVRDPISGAERFARVKVPSRPVLNRLVPVKGKRTHFVLLEEIIEANLARLFHGMEIRGACPFRITRNADIEVSDYDADDDAVDLLELIEEKLSQRRFGEVERLEVASSMSETMRRTLVQELEQVTEEEIYAIEGPLNIADFFPIASLNVPALRDTPFAPAVPPALRNRPDMFTAIRQEDVLLHHPYESFGCVTDFLLQAAHDPQVLTIKHTLYRTSGDSPILQALTEAAENGKQVACLVELKARFDEANNIVWARQLEKYGVHVVYGLLGLKTHCKVTLVVRREPDGLRRYLHIGTGNYNPRTAATYTDIGLLTCAPEFGADATDLFNFLTGYSRQSGYRKFLLAPFTLRKRLKALIEREMERHTLENPGRIIAKMNALVDPELITTLYAASEKGVQVDLIVRGICCLRPGVPGLSENIRVLSVVGRFLEHSRIFYFRNGGEDEEVYIGSADWMPRNLDRRVEVVIPIENPTLRDYLRKEVLELVLADNCQGWDLHPDGRYTRRHPAPGQERINSQQILLENLSR